MQGIVVSRGFGCVWVCVGVGGGGNVMERASDDQREREGVRGERGSKCKCS